MTVAFVRNHTAGTALKAAGTTVDLNISTIVPAGNTIVAHILFDNAAVASKPIVSSIAKAAGETANWVLIGAARSTSATAGAFASGEMWAIKTTVDWPVAVYTVTLDTTTVMKATLAQEFSGLTSTVRSTTGTNYSTTTTAASATTTGTAPVIGDLAIGFMFQSNTAAFATSDTDTTAGSWSAIATFGSTGSGAATNNFGGAQYKILTAATAQTYNAAAALAAGNGSIVAVLQAVLDPTITQASYRFFADDGTEAASTALAAQDTAPSVAVDTDVSVRARVRLQSTNAGVINATDDWQLQWDENAAGTWVNVVNPMGFFEAGGTSLTLGDAATPEGAGQSFTATLAGTLLKARFNLKKAGTPTGNIVARLYAHSGTFGSGGLGTGAPLAVSTTSIAVSSLTTTATWYDFAFDGTFTLAAGTNYVIIAYLDTGGSGVNNVGITVGAFANHVGNGSVIDGAGAWLNAGSDVCFEAVISHASHPPVGPVGSSLVSNNATTTNRLGAGTGSFVAGKVALDGLVEDFTWTSNNYTELEFLLTLRAAQLANADALRFRVLRNGVTTGLTFTQTPTINVTKAVPAVTQAAYRVYDDGTETGAVALAAQNTAANGDITNGDGIGQLRLRLQSTTAAPLDITDDWQLQYEKNASGTWVNVTTGDATVAAFNSASLTDAVATTNRLGAGTGSFVAGKVSEDGLVDNLGWSGNNYTELLFPVAIKKPSVVAGDVIRFRVLRNGATTGMTYTVTPTVNVIKGVTNEPGTITTSWGTWTATGTATPDHPATVTTSWGTWTATGTATVSAGVTNWPATITTIWGGSAVVGDDFNRADAAPPGLGSGWHAPGWGIVSNMANRPAGNGATDYARFLTDLGTLDHWVEVELPFGLIGNDFRVINARRSVDSGSLDQDGVLGFIEPPGNGGRAMIGSVQNGVYANVLAGPLIAPVALFKLRLECEGNTARLYYNDGLVITADISALTNLGNFGGFNANVQNTTFVSFDNFRAGALPYGGGQGWTATAIGTVTAGATDRPATITSSWGTWTATGPATVNHPATVVTSWGTWTATSSASLTHPATVTTSWGTWASTVTAVRTTAAIVTTSWGNWAATATAVRATAASITTSWGTWASTVTGTRETAATITSIWGASAAVKHIWDPLDPAAESTQLVELGTWFNITAPITVYGVRMQGSGDTIVNDRYIKLWDRNASSTPLALKQITDTLPFGGYYEFSFDAPVLLVPGQYAISANFARYLYRNFGLNADVVNGVVTIPQGGGRYNATRGAFPDQLFNETYYYVDLLYAEGQPWTATATATVDHPATVTSNWGTWTATATGTITAGVANWPATITTSWGTWTATATASLTHPATITTSWGTWIATGLATPEVSSVIITSWGTWSATATATRTTAASIATSWGTWTATGTAVRTVAATATTSWGTWTATATAQPLEHPASIITNTGSWAATATAVRTTAASIATSWGTWTATATGVVTAEEIFATITTGWGTWSATAAAAVTHTATIVTSWGTWTATAAASLEHPATVATSWGTWNATATAQAIQRNASITTSWGTWNSTVSATVSRPATIVTNWGTWTANALATQQGQAAGLINTNWGTWTATSAASVNHPSSITAAWGTWAATGTAIRSVTAAILTNWGNWTATAAADPIFHFATITTSWGNWTASATATILSGALTWVGSTADIGVSGQSATFTPGAITWSGSTASAGVAAVSGTFTSSGAVWVGSTATAGVSGVSGTFVGGATSWTGSIADVGVEGVTGLFGAGALAWSGSTAEIAVEGLSGLFLSGEVVWVGSLAEIGVEGVSDLIRGGEVVWLGSLGEVGVLGVSGSFGTGIEGQWDGQAFDAMMYGPYEVVEWLLVPA